MAPKRGSKAPRVAPATSAPRGGKRAREEDTEVVPSTDAKRGRIAKSGLVVVADKKWPTLDARKGQLVALSAAESEAWLGKAAAREASMRLGSGDLLRLVGTMNILSSEGEVSGELVKEEGEEREEGEEGEEAPGAGGSSGGRGKAPAKAAAKAKGQGKAAAKSAGSKAYQREVSVARAALYSQRWNRIK
ncbi:hypothetical protein T492DRAFT_838642 [Pavlovales sp. CCMP2436]|nr:hypothetical protein T492DRAFT_838642 [Pavlovales sp. CCMP2436]